MDFDVIAEISDVNFSPNNVPEEVLQNVKTILTTPKGSVPFFREFGMSTTLLDGPMPVAQAKYSAEIVETVQKYESRVKVTKIKYGGDGKEGKLQAKVQVKIIGS